MTRRPPARPARPIATIVWAAALSSAALSHLLPASAEAQARPATGDAPLTIEHRVPVRSTVPAIAGTDVDLYVRERVAPAVLESGPRSDRGVVLFVHGAGTPSEVAFDVPFGTYSWMEHLASAGFDVFAVDMTGYGRSHRPDAMNDPCNLSETQQSALVPSLIEGPCDATYPHQLTTIASDWNDIDAAVEFIRQLRGVDRVGMVAWSLGGPRAGGYAALHPEKVSRMVLLAPAYSRNRRDEPPALPAPGLPMGLQDRIAFTANWDRQVGCQDQYDPRVSQAVWSEMLASDPVGAGWGPGYRRAPQTTTWGWGPDAVARTTTPTLLVSPPHDAQVNPDRVHELFEDLGSESKILIDLACTSHNAMWERNHLSMFEASAEWLARGTVQGLTSGTLRFGY